MQITNVCAMQEEEEKVNSSKKVHFLLTEACKTFDKLILQLLKLSFEYAYGTEWVAYYA